MSKAIKTHPFKNMIGQPYRWPVAQNIKRIVHDGDTININPVGHFGVRFLGIDTPEVSFQTRFDPTSPVAFRNIDHPKWQEYLTDPFATKWGSFPGLNTNLKKRLNRSFGPHCAANHARHAAKATDALREMVRFDMETLEKAGLEPGFFMVFGSEILDGYGRLLCFINRNQPDRSLPSLRPESYNARLLKEGLATIYTIWPNVDPTVMPDAFSHSQLPNFLSQVPQLQTLRIYVKAAREHQKGIFDASDGLRITPSELRFLGRRQPPFRWVLDLSGKHSKLIDPQDYDAIPMEDRLYLNPEHASLFKEKGW